MKLSSEELSNLAKILEGSCSSLQQALEENFNISEENLTEEDLEVLNNLVYYCEECGWWFDASEKNWSEVRYKEMCSNCLEENGGC